MRTRTYKETYRGLSGLFPYPDTWFWYGALLAALIALPWLVPTYIFAYVTLVMIAVIGAVGLNIVTGTAGLISLGQVGFLAIGAYTTGILTTTYGWGLFPAILASGLVSMGSSLLVGVPSLRLKGLYLAITTLAFSIIVVHFINDAEGLTGGSSGMAVKRPELFGVISMRSQMAMYFLSLGVAVLVILGTINLLRSRVGRAWAALHDYDIAAMLMGINLVRYKLLAFAVSAFIVGIAGALMALNIRYLNTDSFGMILSIEAIAMIIVGGLGSVRGAVLGAVLITLLPDVSRWALAQLGTMSSTLASGSSTEIKGIIYALVIILFLLLEPEGMNHQWKRIKRFWSEWPYSR
ncbi:branched-chain amino acid ABC transporter permease [Paracoccus sp. DMF]|uniref:branched-chain amino acid ABC transporter permease n=1 Tax=Paracoccus sp. DMF TaxID=400837 RepID=UPI0011022F71|nr:branched-chain amino acid ABC transporter permease [Paracoccus sp. DMF]MCV2448835.1 branched-chain amino acid ABC transporter permease [Paracoccus sp. DMF]